MMWKSRNNTDLFRKLFFIDISSCRRRRPSFSISSPVISMMGKRRTIPSSSSFAALLFFGTTTATVGYCSSFPFSSANSINYKCRLAPHRTVHTKCNGNQQYLIATSASINASSENLAHRKKKDTRSYTTKVDRYFQQWRKIPLPPILHDNLERLLIDEKRIDRLTPNTTTNEDRSSGGNNRILVIGDVHGCINELKTLVQTATNEYNNNVRFGAIVLVGDLCNKGPSSAQVIQYVRNQPDWFCVRGNHDDRALSAALGDEECCSKSRYQWVNELCDDDVTWMSNLPYTIKIPKSIFNGDVASSDHLVKQDVIVVHAGLDPTKALDDQDATTMITVRNFLVNEKSKAWAKIWSGPELIIFGHDAKRGLQNEKHAIGLDSGCVYGKKLTGIILPEMELVSVNATKEHCPIKKKS